MSIEGSLISVLCGPAYDALKYFYDKIKTQEISAPHLGTLNEDDLEKLRFGNMPEYRKGISSLVFTYDRICQLEGRFKVFVNLLDSTPDVDSFEKAKVSVEEIAVDIREAGERLEEYENLKELLWISLPTTQRSRLRKHLEEGKYENRKTKMEALFVGLEPPEEVIVSGNEMKISLAYILNYSNELENLRHNVRDVLLKAIELQPSA